MDVASFQAEGRPLLDDRDVEAPWFEWQPSAVPVFFHPTERATRLAALQQLGRKPQIPQDLVVKFQPIDIIGVILWLVLVPRVVYQREIKG